MNDLSENQRAQTERRKSRCLKRSVGRRDNTLNYEFRNGGDLVEDREEGRDSISSMRLAHSRPDVLANALKEMGVIENGDEFTDY